MKTSRIFLAISFVSILGACATMPTKTWTYGDGSVLTIRQMGCLLDLTFKNNSRRPIYLYGDIIVTQKMTGEVLNQESVRWNSNTVPRNSFVKGQSFVSGSLSGPDDEWTQQYKQGFACVNTRYNHKIRYSYE